jgi:hypothetical protein
MALRDTIGRLITQATSSGQAARTRLPKGLTVAIKVEADNLVDVQLSRADVYPSLREWKTVLAQWPGQCAVIQEPKLLLHKNVYYIKGRVRIMPELITGA